VRRAGAPFFAREPRAVVDRPSSVAYCGGCERKTISTASSIPTETASPNWALTSEAAVQLGTPDRAPTGEEVMMALAAPSRNVVANLLSVSVGARSGFGASLLSGLRDLRRRFGRPHWIVSDEVFNAGPSAETERILLVTADPRRLSPDVLRAITLVLAVGCVPEQTLREIADARGNVPPTVGPFGLAPGEALAWRCAGPGPRSRSGAARRFDRGFASRHHALTPMLAGQTLPKYRCRGIGRRNPSRCRRGQPMRQSSTRFGASSGNAIGR
jgi:hypothetical protein